jgi:hypothetical protein
MILLSELSRRRIRSITKLIKVRHVLWRGSRHQQGPRNAAEELAVACRVVQHGRARQRGRRWAAPSKPHRRLAAAAPRTRVRRWRRLQPGLLPFPAPQVGRQEPVMVLRVDKEKGYIDLSKRWARAGAAGRGAARTGWGAGRRGVKRVEPRQAPRALRARRISRWQVRAAGGVKQPRRRREARRVGRQLFQGENGDRRTAAAAQAVRPWGRACAHAAVPACPRPRRRVSPEDIQKCEERFNKSKMVRRGGQGKKQRWRRAQG